MYLTNTLLHRSRQTTGSPSALLVEAACPEREVDQGRTILLDAIALLKEQLSCSSNDANPLFLDAFAQTIHTVCGHQSSLPPATREQLANEVADVLQQYIRDAEVGNRILTKPLGYAGDYLTIDKMYHDRAQGDNETGRLFDRCLLDATPSRAVRNRRELLQGVINETLDHCGDRTARVMSIACGPAREISDVFAHLDDPSRLKVDLLDLDPRAIDSTTSRLSEEGVGERVRLTQGNALRLKSIKHIGEQDLVYSIGLIDYFKDKAVIMLLDQIYSKLAPGGRVVLGNFHTDNIYKPFMDHILDWKLTHRNEADMHRLFQASRFGRICTQIRYEETGINLFAECVKTR